MWHTSLYTSEVYLLFPVLLWGTVRRSWTQRVIDLLRTAPLLFVLGAYASGAPPSGHFVAGTLVYTAVMNVVMAIDDGLYAPYPFTGWNRVAYAFSFLSVVSYVRDAPGRKLPAATRFVVLGANTILLAWVAFDVLAAVPYKRAWGCYSVGSYTTFDCGYCPQWYPLEERRSGRKFLACDEARCVAADGGMRNDNAYCTFNSTAYMSVPEMHDIVPLRTHVFAVILEVALGFYALQVPAAVRRMAAEQCLKEE